MRVTRSAEALLSSSPTSSTSSFSAGFTDYAAQSSSSRCVIILWEVNSSPKVGWISRQSISTNIISFTQPLRERFALYAEYQKLFKINIIKYGAAIALEPENYRHHLCILHVGGRRDRPPLRQWRRRWRRRSVRGRSKGAPAKASNAVIKYSSSLDGWDNEKEWSTSTYIHEAPVMYGARGCIIFDKDCENLQSVDAICTRQRSTPGRTP